MSDLLSLTLLLHQYDFFRLEPSLISGLGYSLTPRGDICIKRLPSLRFDLAKRDKIFCLRDHILTANLCLAL